MYATTTCHQPLLSTGSLCVSGVHLTITESSVLVSWFPLSLFPGVRVTGHVIRYHELPLRHEETLLVNSSSTSAVISGLSEGVSYSFAVMAIITEAGGRALSTGECTESSVFVPGMLLYQITFELPKASVIYRILWLCS